MNRKDFFKIIGIGSVLPFIIPSVVLNKEKTNPIPTKKLNYDKLLKQDDIGGVYDLTDNFFVWLNNNPNKVQFKYVRQPEHEFIVRGRLYLAQSRKMKVQLIPEYPDNMEEVQNLVYSQMAEELNWIYSEHKKTFHIFKAYTSPTIYNPEDFTPRRGIILKYAEV